MINYIKKRIIDIQNSLLEQKNSENNYYLFYSGQLYEVQNLLEEYISQNNSKIIK